MMTNEMALQSAYEMGKYQASVIQAKSAGMTGTELNAESRKIPEFRAARSAKNMLQRPVGFVCKSSAGRVVRLLQPYDSDIFAGQPEDLPAQWGFVWSNDPAHALPFVALSTSPYMTGNCCTENGTVYRSKEDNNVFPPSAYPTGWEEVV